MNIPAYPTHANNFVARLLLQLGTHWMTFVSCSTSSSTFCTSIKTHPFPPIRYLSHTQWWTVICHILLNPALHMNTHTHKTPNLIAHGKRMQITVQVLTEMLLTGLVCRSVPNIAREPLHYARNTCAPKSTFYKYYGT